MIRRLPGAPGAVAQTEKEIKYATMNKRFFFIYLLL